MQYTDKEQIEEAILEEFPPEEILDVEDAESFVRDTRSGGGQHFSEVNIPSTPEPANCIFRPIRAHCTAF